MRPRITQVGTVGNNEIHGWTFDGGRDGIEYGLPDPHPERDGWTLAELRQISNEQGQDMIWSAT